MIDRRPPAIALMGPTATVETVTPRAAAMRDGLAKASPETYAQMETGALAGLVRSEGGRKAALGWALASDPKVLVLISPTAGVDVRSKETLLEAVDGASRRGTGVLVVSDELDDLRACDRVLVMFQGQVVGEHTLIFASATEHIALTHRAFDRRAFATGAVRAALWVMGKPPGLYSMMDVLGMT